MATKTIKNETPKEPTIRPQDLPPKLIGLIADEVAKTLITRLPNVLPRPRRRTGGKKTKKIEFPIFLDTSAIIDGRIFDVINLGLLNGVIVIPESILMELKHLADSQDTVKRERGRKGLVYLEKLRKTKKIKVQVIDEPDDLKDSKTIEVDEKLIKTTKHYKGKLITCDYNLEKKASVENVTAINVNALANCLKVIAVPGEALHIKVLHQGKEASQGVGYLDDGTMIVVESGHEDISRTIDVVVSRVIQTATGRILFAKKIS
jgi:uncharacterized protein YacL